MKDTDSTPEQPVPPTDFGKTAPLPAVTAQDVLEVFGLFQKSILDRLDERDQRVLDAIKQIGLDVMAYYEQEARRGDEHQKLITALRERTHKHSSILKQFELRLQEVERALKITPPNA